MDENLRQRFETLEQKVDQIYISVEKTRKYFQIVMWITVITVALPLVILLFAIPSMISTFTALSPLI